MYGLNAVIEASNAQLILHLVGNPSIARGILNVATERGLEVMQTAAAVNQWRASRPLL
jgi:hypothetical protein